MTKAEEYRKNAEAADEQAQASRDYHAKQTYEQVARDWLKMAEQAERNGW
jgi:hypothetical protein